MDVAIQYIMLYTLTLCLLFVGWNRMLKILHVREYINNGGKSFNVGEEGLPHQLWGGSGPRLFVLPCYANFDWWRKSLKKHRERFLVRNFVRTSGERLRCICDKSRYKPGQRFHIHVRAFRLTTCIIHLTFITMVFARGTQKINEIRVKSFSLGKPLHVGMEVRKKRRNNFEIIQHKRRLT